MLTTPLRRHLLCGFATLALAVLTALPAHSAAPAKADTTGPQLVLANSLFFKVGSTLSDSTASAYIPANITWSTSDPSRICHQDLSIYDAGEGYDEFSPRPSARQFVDGAGMTTPWIGVDLSSRDCAGNTTGTEKFYDPSLYQQRTATLTGQWSTSSCVCWSGGSVATSSTVGATASFTFHGGSLALISDKAAQRGIAEIYIDGTLASTVNTAGATKNRVVVFQHRWKAPGDHKIKVVVASGRVDVDGFVVDTPG
jgi:hypothetical protein